MKEKYDISIHFQTKTNSIEEIENKLRTWCDSEKYNGVFDIRESQYIKGTVQMEYTEPRTILHHCFLRQQELPKLNLPKDKVDLIKDTFDFLDSLCDDIVQWNGVCSYEDGLYFDRLYMLENIKKCNGISLFIGDIIDGVKEEYDIAQEIGVDYILIP